MIFSAAFLKVAAVLPLAGMLAGFLAGLLGVGGGIVLVPSLFYAMKAAGLPGEILMHLAVGTSLAIIVPTGFSSARAHARRGAVDREILKRMGGGVIAGVVAGTAIAGNLSGAALTILFAAALMVLAVIMMAGNRFALHPRLFAQPWCSLAGGLIGMLSTLIGIGGATVSVPYMTLCGMPLHRAIGTAAALGLLISIPASAGFVFIGQKAAGLPVWSLGYVNIAAWAIIMPFSVMAAPFGARAAHALPVARLRIVFAGFMIVVALHMLYSVASGS